MARGSDKGSRPRAKDCGGGEFCRRAGGDVNKQQTKSDGNRRCARRVFVEEKGRKLQLVAAETAIVLNYTNVWDENCVVIAFCFRQDWDLCVERNWTICQRVMFTGAHLNFTGWLLYLVVTGIWEGLGILELKVWFTRYNLARTMNKQNIETFFTQT